MTQLRARILTATALLVAALASLARAEEILLWTAREDGGLVSLSYSSFDRGTIPIFNLSYFNGMNIAVLNLHEELSGTEPGQKITIDIAAEAGRTPVQGEAAPQRAGQPPLRRGERHRHSARAERAEDAWAGYTVSVSDTRVTLPDTGRSEAVAQFSKDCQVE